MTSGGDISPSDYALIYVAGYEHGGTETTGMRAFPCPESAKEWLNQKANKDLSDMWLHDSAEGVWFFHVSEFECTIRRMELDDARRLQVLNPHLFY